MSDGWNLESVPEVEVTGDDYAVIWIGNERLAGSIREFAQFHPDLLTRALLQAKLQKTLDAFSQTPGDQYARTRWVIQGYAA